MDLEKAKFQNLAVMDGDLQHRPSDLIRLINEFNKTNMIS